VSVIRSFEELPVRHSRSELRGPTLAGEGFLWTIDARSQALAYGVAMSGKIKAIGRGLFGAGSVLILLYLAALHLRGVDTLRDALYPFAITTYLPLLLLTPGALLLWLADQVGNRQSVFTLIRRHRSTSQ
jgi:hypothetical protein